MSLNLTVESPQFDKIRKGDTRATEDAIRLLWYVINEALRAQRMDTNETRNRLSPKVLSLALAANQNNLDVGGAGLVVYTGADAYDVTGYLSREEGDILFVHNTGAGTITHKNASASSDATNRFVNNGAADVAIATNQSATFIYYDSRWREWSAA